MGNILKKKCVPCEERAAPLKKDELKVLFKDISPKWKILNEHHLEREFTFKDFKKALVFTNLVGKIAEAEGHHPDIQLSWGRVRIMLWTHSVNGLSENDFIVAAKIDALS